MLKLIFFEQDADCPACEAAKRVIEDVAAAGEDVSLERFNVGDDAHRAAEFQVDRVPAVIVKGPRSDRIRYYGAPAGRELPTLVEAVHMSRTGETRLSEHSRQQLQRLTKPVQVQVFFTPTCVTCPQMISLANQAAVESPFVSAAAIDATEFPDLVRRFKVNGVPKTVINDTVEILGAASEEEFIRAVTLGIGD